MPHVITRTSDVGLDSVGQPYWPKSIELRHGLVGATKKTSGMCRGRGGGRPKSVKIVFSARGPDHIYFPIQFPIQWVPGALLTGVKAVFT